MTNLKNQIISTLLEEVGDVETWSLNHPKYFGPDTRTLAIFGEIDNSSAYLIISQLEHLAHLAQDEPITLHLNTEGGSLTDAFAIYDCIVNLPCPVIILATGLCASAGLLILSAADYKMATQSTTFYYHQPIFSQPGIINSAKDMNTLNSYYQFCQTQLNNKIKPNLSISKSHWEKYFKASTGYYFDAAQALKYNFIDKISTSMKLNFQIKDLIEQETEGA
jgi:ATP-dependent Clp protease, protease subunit